MTDGEAFDLVLFGYRNDVARERVLEYLAALPVSAGVPAIERTTPVPQRLFRRIAARRAQELRDDLERLGAQVSLVPVSVAPPVAPAPTTPARVRPLTLLLVGLLAVAGALKWRQSSPPTGDPAPTGSASVSAPAAPLRSIEPIAETHSHDQARASELNAEAVELAQQGHFEAAAERLRHALRLMPGHPLVQQNLQAVLLSWGLKELDDDRLGFALQHLNEALGFGDRSDLRRALGVTHLRAGDFSEARADLDRAVAAGANDPTTWLALGEASLRLNDRPRALDALQRAREAGAHGPQLDTLLQRLGREVDAEWDFSAMESAHFRITFEEARSRSAAQAVLAGLEDARAAVGRKFGYFPDRRIEAVLYGAQDFHAITQTPVWAAAAYDGRIKVPARGLDMDDPMLVKLLRHEYMHSLVAELANNVCPVWLNEGLAVWAEEDVDGERRAWADDTIRGAPLFSLTDLTGPLTRLPSPRAAVAYAQSYLAVRELIDRYGARKLPQFVTEVGRQPLAGAFATVYPSDLSDFEEKLLRSLSS